MVMGDPELGAMSHTRLEITGFPGVRGTQVILKLGFSDRIPRNCWEVQMLLAGFTNGNPNINRNFLDLYV